MPDSRLQVWGTTSQEPELYDESMIACDPAADGGGDDDDDVGSNADGGRDDGNDSSTAVVAASVSVFGVVLLVGIVAAVVRQHRTKLQVKKGAFFLDEMVRKVAEQVRQQLVAQWKHVLLRVDRDLEAAAIANDRDFDLLRVGASELEIDPAKGQGRGKLGDVSLGHLRRTTLVVIEVVSRRDKDSLAAFVLDAQVMHLLKHEHIVKVVAVIDRELPMMLALEHMPGGNLRQHLKDCRPSMGPGRKAILHDADLHDWIAQLAAAGEFLESRKVIHRSLKAENVLLSADTRTAKLANFGETREIYEAEEYVARNFKESLQQQLAVRWMAPETVAQGVYTPFTDMWSFGILIWEVTTFGRTPYGALTAQEIVKDISSGRRLQPPMTCSQPTAELMVFCWHEVPTQRCSFGDIRATLALQRLPGGTRHLDSQARARVFSAEEMAVQTIPAGAFEPASLLLPKGGLFNRRLLQWTAGASGSTSPQFSIGVSVADSGNREEDRLLRADLAFARMLPSADRILAFQGLCSHPAHGTAIIFGWGLGDPTTLMTTAIPLPHRPRAVLDIALGLEHIHASRLVMKNLAPAIAITAAPHFRVKLLVTEVASISGDAMGAVDNPAAMDDSLWWQAPETIAVGTLLRASNVWAFGSMVYSMFNFETSKAPLMKRFSGKLAMVQEVREAGGQLPPLELKSAGPFFEALVQACQQQDPQSRATIPDLIGRLEVHMSKDSARWEVQRSWLEQLRLLGDGEFGDVVLMMLTRPKSETVAPSQKIGKLDACSADAADSDGNDGTTQMMVAGKTLKQGAHGDAQASFLRELEIMKRLRHPHLVTLIGAVTKDAPQLILLEYSVGGDLEGWVWRNASQFRVQHLVQILHQIALGMGALGQHHIIHRDLAARNVLVGERNVCKVADYGLSRELTDDKTYYRLKSGLGVPLRWTAPESVITSKWTTKSDVYSFGVVISEVFSCCQKDPFEPLNNNELIKLFRPGVTVPLIDHLSFTNDKGAAVAPAGMIALAGRCIDRSVAARPTFVAVAKCIQEQLVLAVAGGQAVDTAPTDQTDRTDETAGGHIVVKAPGAGPPRPTVIENGAFQPVDPSAFDRHVPHRSRSLLFPVCSRRVSDASWAVIWCFNVVTNM